MIAANSTQNSADLVNGYRLDWRWVGGGPYADALWTKDLADDEDSDWTFPGEMLVVSVFSADVQVGKATFSYLCSSHGGHLACFNIFIKDDHRRNGLAKGMYDRAEMEFGDRVLPYPGNEGGAISHFWLDRLRDEPDLIEQYRNDIGGPALTWSSSSTYR